MTDDIGTDNGYPEVNQRMYESPGDAQDRLGGLLGQILGELKQPTVLPKAQIKLSFPAAGTSTEVFSTHVRYYIESYTVVGAPTVPINVNVGALGFLEGIGITAVGSFACSFIIEPGVDVAAVGVGGAPYAARTSLLLNGWIIN